MIRSLAVQGADPWSYIRIYVRRLALTGLDKLSSVTLGEGILSGAGEDY